MHPHVPLGALSRLQRHHAGAGRAPLLAEGVAEVVLVLNGYEVLRRWRVGLDGLDLRRKALDAHAVARRRVKDLDRGSVILPNEVAPVVVEKVGSERRAAGTAQVEFGSGYRQNLARSEER